MKNTNYQKLRKFQIRIIPLCYSVYYETCFLMIQRSQTRGYSDTTECYYFYATGNEQLTFLRSSAIFCDHMETGRIVFVAILQLRNLLPGWGWGGGGVSYKSEEFDRR